MITAFMPLQEQLNDVCRVNFDFFLRHRGVEGTWNENYTDWLTDGMLSYKDKTYISIRDLSDIFQKNVEWDEDRKRITLIEQQHEELLFEQDETAKKIAKAIAEEKFSDLVGEKTGYEAYSVRVRNDVFYDVHIMFNTDLLSEGEKIDCSNSDAIIKINHYDWKIDSIEIWDDERENYYPIDSRK